MCLRLQSSKKFGGRIFSPFFFYEVLCDITQQVMKLKKNNSTHRMVPLKTKKNNTADYNRLDANTFFPVGLNL